MFVLLKYHPVRFAKRDGGLLSLRATFKQMIHHLTRRFLFQ